MLLRLYARVLIGRRAQGRKPQKRGKNITIISAISLEKVVASVTIYGAVDAVPFEGFILKEVLPKIKEGDCLIMDNAKIHLVEMVKEIIKQEKAALLGFVGKWYNGIQ